MDTVLDPSAPPQALAAKPSLAGLGREGLRAALAADRRARQAAQACASASCGAGSMCAAPRPSTTMSDVSKELRAPAVGRLYAGPARDRRRAGVGRRHAQVAAAAAQARPREARRPRSRRSTSPRADRGTLCISSQVGCTLTCSFCHTGTQRLVRNLEPRGDRRPDPAGARPHRRLAGRGGAGDGGLIPRRERKITNVVLMGMGEPLYNFDNVRDAMAVAADGEGLALVEAAHHAVDQRRRAGDPALGRRGRHHARDLAACGARRAARRAGADQQASIRSPS